MKKIKIEVKEMAYAATFYWTSCELEFQILSQHVDPFLKLVENFRKISEGRFARVKTCPHQNDNLRSQDIVRCDQHGEFWIALKGLTN